MIKTSKYFIVNIKTKHNSYELFKIAQNQLFYLYLKAYF